MNIVDQKEAAISILKYLTGEDQLKELPEED